MAEQGFLSRSDLLGGRLSLDRRAMRLLGTIEARVSHMKGETKLAVRALFSGREADFTRTFGDDYLRSLRLSARIAESPRVGDIERFASQWKILVPPEPDVRAALIDLLIARHRVSPARTPGILEAAGHGEAAVREAYQSVFGAELDDSVFPAIGDASFEPAEGTDTDPESLAIAWAEEALEWLSAPAGTVLMREGELPDYLYFIVSGRLRITSGSGPVQRLIAELGRGELVGEIGVLTGEPRTATVTAMRDSEVVRLPQSEVLRMAYQSPNMLLRVNKILATRLRIELSSVGRGATPHLTLAVVGLDESVPVRRLAADLVEAIKPLGPVAHVTRERAEREFPRLNAGVDPSQDVELLAWLSEQEAQHQFVVFEAEPVPGRWTDLCLRQADRVALVADGTGNPARRTLEVRVSELNPTARLDLVLLQQPGSLPSGTRGWLDARQVAGHHHVALGDRAHTGRLARRLVGQAVGLVLGGGGARGFAHIGAWKAFQEAGIPVDMVGGTSVGAIMAAGIASDRDPKELEELGRVYAETKLTDLTLPVVSFFRSKAITKLLYRHGENRRIEDLYWPFFCISTSLSRGEPVVHRRGPLWKAARASSAIPGLFAPVAGAGGDLLVDGGIINNVPVDVMRADCERGPVIAIDLSPTAARTDNYSFGPEISGWQVLWSKLNPFVTPMEVPSIFGTLLRTTEAGSAHRMRTGEVLAMADLVIRPPTEHGGGLLDFGKLDEFIQIGYEATVAALEGVMKENPSLDRKLRAGRA